MVMRDPIVLCTRLRSFGPGYEDIFYVKIYIEKEDWDLKFWKLPIRRDWDTVVLYERDRDSLSRVVKYREL